MGSNETLKCQSCKYKVDRDINGARNILINNFKLSNKKQKKILTNNKKFLQKNKREEDLYYLNKKFK